MISKLVLLSNLLFASVALAVPSSRLTDRLVRRLESHQPHSLQRVEAPAGVGSNIIYTSNDSGAILEGSGGAFTTVTGTFTIPTPTLSEDISLSIWVGIDGYTCANAIFQTGIDVTVSSGEVSYEAWYEWYPDYAYAFSGISISAGDIIKATVIASSTTSGTAIIENVTTGQTVQQELASTYALCEQDAEWIVQDNGEGSPGNFGTVAFSNATASGPGGTYTPAGATIIEIEDFTTVTISGETITVRCA